MSTDTQTDINAAAETLGSLDSSRQTPFNTDGLPGVTFYEESTGGGPEVSIEARYQQQLDPGLTEWNQKEWNDFIQDTLLFLNETNPADGMRTFHTEKQVLPEGFDHQNGVFCYAYKGNFLPSGHSDGRVWKPSQGPKRTGSYMLKRYFYHKDSQSGIQTKRQVTWLVGREGWCFIEYRNSASKGKIKLEDIMSLPTGIDWPLLISLVSNHQASRVDKMSGPLMASAFVSGLTNQLSGVPGQNMAALPIGGQPNFMEGPSPTSRKKRGAYPHDKPDGTFDAIKKAKIIMKSYAYALQPYGSAPENLQTLSQSKVEVVTQEEGTVPQMPMQPSLEPVQTED